MKRLLLLPLSLLFFACTDSSEADPEPMATTRPYSGDFRAGNWYEAKAAVLSKDITPASDEGNLVLMPFNRRNSYDVYEFRDGVLVGGLVLGGAYSEEYNRLLSAYGAPVAQGETFTRWTSARSSIELAIKDGKISVYYTPL